VPSSVFITGATGVVGSHLLATLLADGEDVTALVRTRDAAAAVSSAGARPVLGDIREPDRWASSLRRADAVFHVAGINEACPADRAAMQDVNVAGAVGIVEAASDAGVGRLVLTSSVAAIGEAAGSIGTEETVHSGKHLSIYARTKHEGEIAARRAAAVRDLDIVIVNPASVQGPGRSTGSAELLLRVMRCDRPFLVDAVVSVLDIEDCSRGHILASEVGVPGERYILSGATLSVSAIVRIVDGIVGMPVNPRWLSRRVAGAMGVPVAAVVSLLKPDAGVCPDLVRTLLHGHSFSNRKSRMDLGLAYTPIETTIERTLEWFEDEGLLSARS
jgi:dihydroflavonol-4-reductase